MAWCDRGARPGGIEAPNHQVSVPDRADFVVVGGGTTGCVVAARLSEDPAAQVLLLEAGSGYRSTVDLPGVLDDPYLLPVGPASEHTWTYPVELTPSRRATVSRGRTLGGSGAVNGAYFARATRTDFDLWPDSWSYEKVLPYFRKSETDHDFGGPYHGDNGPIPVRRRQLDDMHPFSSRFHDAALAAGFPEDADKNAPDSNGVGPVPLNISDHRRISTAVGYLLPAMGRRNLTVDVGVTVLRIVFSGTRAVGVDVLDGTALRRIRGRHIVVCSGAVATPLLLLNSGVGSADQLVAHDVPVVVDLPGVGQGFVDHPEVLLPYRYSVPEALRPQTPVLEMALNDADLEIRPYTASFTDLVPGIPQMDHGIGVVLMAPRSRGTVELDPKAPGGSPRIRYNYVDSAHDRRVLRRGMQIAEDLLETIAKTGMIRRPEIEYSDEWIESRLGTSLHMSGSCVMGSEFDPDAVVNDRCSVLGVEALSIVDTSIMPVIPTRGPHATAVMLAERASELVRDAARA